MSDKVGTVMIGHKNELVFLGRDLDEEIKAIIDNAHDQAKRILTENRTVLDRIAERLKVVETIDRPEFDTMVGEAGTEARDISYGSPGVLRY